MRTLFRPRTQRLPSNLSRAASSIVIETGQLRNAGMQTTNVNEAFACLFTSRVADGSKLLSSVAVNFQAVSGTPAPFGYLYDCNNGRPFGNWSTKAGALAVMSAGVTVAAGYVNYAYDTGYAILPDHQYAHILAFTSGSTSFNVNYNPLLAVRGWAGIHFSAPATDIEDSVDEWAYGLAPMINLNFSDGSQEAVHLGSGGTSAGNVAVYGIDRWAGVGIRPSFDLPVYAIDMVIEKVVAAGSPGTAAIYVYTRAGQLVAQSSNTIVGADFSAGSQRRVKRFRFTSPFMLWRDRDYYIVLAQTGNTGDSSNYFRPGGSVGTGYVTNAFPPETWGENPYHGLWSVNTSTGFAGLAFNATSSPYVAIYAHALRR